MYKTTYFIINVARKEFINYELLKTYIELSNYRNSKGKNPVRVIAGFVVKYSYRNKRITYQDYETYENKFLNLNPMDTYCIITDKYVSSKVDDNVFIYTSYVKSNQTNISNIIGYSNSDINTDNFFYPIIKDLGLVHAMINNGLVIYKHNKDLDTLMSNLMLFNIDSLFYNDYSKKELQDILLNRLIKNICTDISYSNIRDKDKETIFKFILNIIDNINYKSELATANIINAIEKAAQKSLGTKRLLNISNIKDLIEKLEVIDVVGYYQKPKSNKNSTALVTRSIVTGFWYSNYFIKGFFVIYLNYIISSIAYNDRFTIIYDNITEDFLINDKHLKLLISLIPGLYYVTNMKRIIAPYSQDMNKYGKEFEAILSDIIIGINGDVRIDLIKNVKSVKQLINNRLIDEYKY